MLNLNSQQTAQDLEQFIKTTVIKQGFKKLVIGVSGGIDSATSLVLATKALGAQNVHALSLPYGNRTINHEPSTMNHQVIDIQPMVDSLKLPTNSTGGTDLVELKMRKGNIMARVRMIILYDYAKKHNALVCGTENRSEYFLGYY
ncbi:MAG: NAD(+) synthase, partial [bacterium]|nr:NAD(+) synthase [bacterium]